MFEILINIDKKLFLFFNSFHNEWMDTLMYWISYKYTWIPLYILVIIYIFKHHKNKFLFYISCILITFALTDQCSNILKNSTKRLRPSHNPEFEQVIHLNHNYKGGKYGFVSSHAANTAGLTTILIFLGIFKKNIYKHFFIFWTLLVSYSRVYNGLHYPADIVGGIILGIFIAFIVNYLTKIVILKYKT